MVYFNSYDDAPIVSASASQPSIASEAPRTLADKYQELGNYYFRDGRFEEAAEAFARARTYAPNDASLHLSLADAAFATGDFHFAAFLIREALRLDPSLAGIRFDKRTLYGDSKRFDEHMAALEEYLGKHSFDAMAHLVHGYNLLCSESPVRAIAALRRAREISPGDTAVEAFLASLEAARK